MLDRFFKLSDNKTTVRTEIVAGITTFMTMAYILAVNPDILSKAGMDKGAVFTATIVSSVIATLVMSLWANLPFALAPGMGLNAFFCLHCSTNHGVFMAVCHYCSISRRTHFSWSYCF